MPIIKFYSPNPTPPSGFLEQVSIEIQITLSLADDHVWSFWNPVAENCFFKPGWDHKNSYPPVVEIRCKSTYSHEQISNIMSCITGQITNKFAVKKSEIYIVVDKVLPKQLFVRGKIWQP